MSGDIKVFFMEWFRPIVPYQFNECFKDLALEDASPTLRELAALCHSKWIDIVSCDLSVDTTINILNNNKNDRFAGQYAPASAYQPWGKAVRDRYAAEKVRTYMDLHPDAWDHALLMFGADHFKCEEDRNAPSLHHMIELQFAEKDGVGFHIKFLN
jgi:hypothetical protein